MDVNRFGSHTEKKYSKTLKFFREAAIVDPVAPDTVIQAVLDEQVRAQV